MEFSILGELKQPGDSVFVASQIHLSVPGCPELKSMAIVWLFPQAASLVLLDKDIAPQEIMTLFSSEDTTGAFPLRGWFSRSPLSKGLWRRKA